MRFSLGFRCIYRRRRIKKEEQEHEKQEENEHNKEAKKQLLIKFKTMKAPKLQEKMYK